MLRRVYRLNDHEGAGGLILGGAAELEDALDGADIGDRYFLYIEEMEDADFRNLPEFDGF